MPRPYRVPFSPWFPILGIAFAVYLMIDLPLAARGSGSSVWLALGVLIYCAVRLPQLAAADAARRVRHRSGRAG